MKDEKLYAERDHRALKPRYSGDISAMTAEDLREKGDILDKLVRREEGGDDMSKLREAARAVVDQWDTPNWNLDMHTGVLIDRLRAALAQPETAEPPRDEWREVVHEHLITCHIFSKENSVDPRQALSDLIAWHCKIALDPAVSIEAQELFDRGRRSVAPTLE